MEEFNSVLLVPWKNISLFLKTLFLVVGIALIMCAKAQKGKNYSIGRFGANNWHIAQH